MNRRTLTILKLTDGVWVIESTLSLHHPGSAYAGEAKTSLFAIFKGKRKVLSPKEKARIALSEFIGGMGKDELYTLPHFHEEGAQYHPVVAPFDQFMLDSSLIRWPKKTGEWKITPLDEHPLRKKLKERLNKFLG